MPYLHTHPWIVKNPETLGKAMQEAFLAVDNAMRLQFTSDPDEHSGCTAVAVVVTPLNIITANAGDSRALLSRNQINVVRN